MRSVNDFLYYGFFNGNETFGSSRKSSIYTLFVDVVVRAG
jgi:hypothetical protein